MARRKSLSSRTKTEPPQTIDDSVRGTLVMFVDIMGASEVSNHNTPAVYADFVTSFQELFTTVCKAFRDEWHKDHEMHMQFNARGDEGLLMIYRPSASSNLAEDVELAINVALELKRRWLCCSVNTRRVNDELLPVGLGIGIHVGKTCVRDGKVDKDGNPGGLQPEGYAINLAKRVEAYSRNGRFTHIFVSEAAHGQIAQLADEITFLFSEPETMSPKGISQRVQVYEVKHHFLPIDWTYQSKPVYRSRSLLNPDVVNVEVVEKALSANPTNLWLAEEFIRSSMLREYYCLEEAGRENLDDVRRALEPARQQADTLKQSHQRDAGVLFIAGLIESEGSEFDRERSEYDQAIVFNDQLPHAYWYRGLSYSFQVWEKTDEDIDIKYGDLNWTAPL